MTLRNTSFKEEVAEVLWASSLIDVKEVDGKRFVRINELGKTACFLLFDLMEFEEK